MIFLYTPEERAQLEALDREELSSMQRLAVLRQEYGTDSPEFAAAYKDHIAGGIERQQAFKDLLDTFEAARFQKLHTPEEIIQDARQQAQDAIVYVYARIWAYTPENERGKRYIVDMASGGFNTYPLGWDFEDVFKIQKAATFNPDENGVLLDAAGLTTYILRDVLGRHTAALAPDNPLLDIVTKIVADSPYTLDTAATPIKAELITADSAIFKANMPIYHGKATDILAALSSQDFTQSGTRAVIETPARDYKIVITDFDKQKGKLSVNTHKLLSVGIAEFTQINNYGGGTVNPRVSIPFDYYARLLGYEIDERQTDSPEAAAKEKKRAAEAVKTAKKRIRQDLELLQAMRWTWQERIKGKGTDFDSILLLERIAIKNGYIIMEFGRNMAAYLKQLPLTQYPQGLLQIDARSENAYRIGLKMVEHYNMDSNQIRGTNNRLRVSSLLKATSLPTIETLQNERHDNSRQWTTRIKDPFENALDTLLGKVLESWEYVKGKGEPLPAGQAIADYEAFQGLYVQFTMLDAPDHEDRLARRAEEKKIEAAKKAARETRGRKKKQG